MRMYVHDVLICNGMISFIVTYVQRIPQQLVHKLEVYASSTIFYSSNYQVYKRQANIPHCVSYLIHIYIHIFHVERMPISQMAKYLHATDTYIVTFTGFSAWRSLQHAQVHYFGVMYIYGYNIYANIPLT